MCNLCLLQTGTIVSLLSAPLIIQQYDWPAVFYIFGSVGFIWLAAWQPLGKDRTQSPQAAASLPAETTGILVANPSSTTFNGAGRRPATEDGTMIDKLPARRQEQTESMHASTSSAARKFDIRSVCSSA
jgi:hypothetical protein